ncbi:MAG: hypothetical protein QM687_08255, partial [Ferruginibacter sp.]
PYAFAENSVIRFIELEGAEKAEPFMFELTKVMLDALRRDVQTSGNNTTLINGLTKIDVLNQLERTLTLASGVNDSKNVEKLSKTTLGGWYCGFIAALGAASMNNPMAYASMVWDLVTTGKTTHSADSKKSIVLPDWLRNIDMSTGLSKINNDGQSGHGSIFDAIDVIMVLSLRSSENDHAFKGTDLYNSYKLKAAGTLPWEVNDLFKRLGMQISSQSFFRLQSNRTLKNLEKAVQNGYTPILFDDEYLNNGASMPQKDRDKTTITNGINLRTGDHYLVLLDLKLNRHNRTVTYTIMADGRRATFTISYKQFKKGMHGYWIPKNK